VIGGLELIYWLKLGKENPKRGVGRCRGELQGRMKGLKGKGSAVRFKPRLERDRGRGKPSGEHSILTDSASRCLGKS